MRPWPHLGLHGDNANTRRDVSLGIRGGVFVWDTVVGDEVRYQTLINRNDSADTSPECLTAAL